VTTAYLNPEIEYGELLDVRDNRVYRTVKIGEQVWMAQNLAYEDEINTVSLQGQMWCYYDSLAFCETFGRIYSWSAVMGFNSSYNSTSAASLLKEVNRGICPEGFHVPSDAEWTELIDYVDAHNGAEGIGSSLKSRYLWQARDSISGGTDLFGFSALPADDRAEGQTSIKVPSALGFDDNVFRGGHWWSSTEYDGTQAWGISMDALVERVKRASASKLKYARTLRCLQD
jgi:uncharacterized protein (TIGR02145 family)